MEFRNQQKNGAYPKSQRVGNLIYSKMKKVVLSAIICVVMFSAKAGDVLTLTNDMVFNGKVTKVKDCEVVFKADGQKFIVPASDIFSLQFEDTDDKVYRNYLALLEKDPSQCMNGRLDAESYHGKKGTHVALGFLFGPFAMLGTAMANPTPEKGKSTYMMSKNKEHFSDLEYLSCYKKKAKVQLIGMEAIGWGGFLLLLLLI